jgi:hypothetical protein
MCGIVSIISKRQAGFYSSDLGTFENLLILDTLRGLDSTGVMCIDSARQVGVMKVASHPFHLFAAQDYTKWRGRAVGSGRILVGHNRKATQGSINSKNAHPFHSGNIVLVHNGTLRGDHKKDFANVDVDSHSLAIAFDENGAEDVLPKINGAFALIWWDIEKNSLFAIRNDERPLQVVETADNFYVLSEAWMALQLLSKENTKVLDVFDIQPGELYEFKIGGKHTTKKIEVQTDYWTNNTSYHTGRSRYAQHGGANASSVQSPKSPPSSSQTGTGGTSTGQSGTTAHSGTGSTNSSQSQPQSTALTLVKNSSSPTKGGTDGKEAGSRAANDVPLPMDMATHVPCAEFTVGMAILVKLYEMKLNDSRELYFCRGKVCEPGAPEIDVATYIKASEIPEGQAVKYIHAPVEATVRKHTQSSCGRSLYVAKVVLPEFVNVHNHRIAETEWNYITAYCKCGVCQKRIHDEDRDYTGVMRKPGNKYSVTCADCIEENLKGAEQHEFTQNRLASLQAYQRECDALAGSHDCGPSPEPSRTPTVH